MLPLPSKTLDMPTMQLESFLAFKDALATRCHVFTRLQALLRCMRYLRYIFATTGITCHTISLAEALITAAIISVASTAVQAFRRRPEIHLVRLIVSFSNLKQNEDTAIERRQGREGSNGATHE